MINIENILNTLSQHNIFLTGGAGVGKTTITNQIIKSYEEEGKKVLKLASTGLAATLINGQTIHSFFDFGIANNIEELQRNKKLEIPRKVKKILQNIELIIIDEISMVSDKLFEMLRLRLLQADYTNKLMVVGDFLQLPPISKHGVFFAFESSSWEKFNFKTVLLKKVYRTQDERFIHLLHAIRYGEFSENIKVDLESFIKPLPQDLREFTFLFGKNNSANLHNQYQLNFIQTPLHVKEAEVMIHDKKVKDKEIEKYFEDAKIEKYLHVKVGAPVLFVRNAWNYYNGERGIITKIEEKCLHVKKTNGITIKLMPQKQSKTQWKEITKNGQKEYEEIELFSIYQYPIKLAFAITIHKSQGMSLDDVIIETNEIFTPSQFYVALSRIKNPSRLILIQPRKHWKNLIYVHKKAVDFYKILEDSVESSTEKK